MKKLLSILLVMIFVFTLSGCAKKTDPTTVTVACMTGPTGVGMAKLWADADADKTDNNYEINVYGAASDFTGKFLNGEINIASVPTNVAATLYNKSEGKVKMLAVNTYGVLSILEKGDSIKSVEDLRGKTIYSTGEGQNPEYILKYILTENGIDPTNDVTIKFVSSDELVSTVLTKPEVEVALVPEPAATTILTKNDAFKRALSINDEWSKVSDTQLMMGCVIALDSYVEENSEAVDKFLKEYEASIKFATENIDDTATYCEKYGITTSAAIAKKAIPTCNLCFITENEMKTNVNGYFTVLFNANPKSIGGKMPADDFYYNAE